jgi:regulator of sigma E protease
MIVTVLAFLATLAVLIVFHEYGHYRTAVACGVKVLRFSVGFGPVLWRWRRTPDSTEFVLSALPLGGYVRMLDEREGAVLPSERGQAFNLKPLWQRAAVVAAGPAANLLLAVLLYAASHWVGVDEPKARLGTPAAGSLSESAGLRAGDWVQSFSLDGVEWQDVRSMTDLRWDITQAVLKQSPLHLAVTDGAGQSRRQVLLGLDTLGATDLDARVLQRIGLGAPYSEPRMGTVNPGGAAARAGLLPGDRVLRIDGLAVNDGEHLRSLIRAHTDPAVPMDWLVERGGQRLEVAVSPAAVQDGERTVGRIDAVIAQPPEMVTVTYGLVDGFSQAVVRTWDMATLTLRMLGRMLIGEASLKNLSGPLTIADYAGQSVRLGAGYYLGFLAVVSISLGVLNLLPLPMLDGGHLMYYLFEAATGRPPSDLWLERLQRGGLAIMLMMMSLAFYNDVARYLGLH